MTATSTLAPLFEAVPNIPVENLASITEEGTFVEITNLTAKLGFDRSTYVSHALWNRCIAPFEDEPKTLVANLSGSLIGYLENVGDNPLCLAVIDLPPFLLAGEIRHERIVGMMMQDNRGKEGLVLSLQWEMDDDDGEDEDELEIF